MDIKKLINFDKLKEKAKEKGGKNHIPNLLILLLMGILLTIGSNTLKNDTITTFSESPENNTSIEENALTSADEEGNYVKTNEEEELENKLKGILERIEGVGEVNVMLYFKGGEEQIPAININDSTSLTEEKDTDGGTRKITQNNDGRTIVMMNTENGTEPFVIRKQKPEVTGVCVVAEGAENNLTKLQIHKAVLNLFGLKENEVNVYAMEK